MKDNNEIEYLKVGAIAKLLGVSTQTVRNYAYTKGLKPDLITAGGRRLYEKEKIIEFLKREKRR